MGEWWEEAFRADYLRVYPHRDDAEAAVDIADLTRVTTEWGQKLLGLAEGKRVLDLGCGAGRHLRAMRGRGIRTLGADFSADLLAEARRRESGPLVRCDMRRLPFRDAVFDAVTMFFNSFGYFDSEAQDRTVLAEAVRVLAPGGGLLVDLMNAAMVRARLVPRSERREGSLNIVEERSLAEDGRRVVKRVTLRERDRVRTWTESVRLYTRAEFREVAKEAGLRVRYMEQQGTLVLGPLEWSPVLRLVFVKGAA